MLLDVLAIALLVLLLVSGYRTGFIRSFFGLVGFLATLIITKLLYRPFTAFLYQTPIYKTVSDALNQALDFEFPEVIPPAFLEALGITDALASATFNILGILCYILLFILIYLVLSFLIRALEGVFRLPGLNFLNRLLGSLLNGLKGALLLYVIALILNFFRADLVASSAVLSGILSAVPAFSGLVF